MEEDRVGGRQYMCWRRADGRGGSKSAVCKCAKYMQRKRGMVELQMQNPKTSIREGGAATLKVEMHCNRGWPTLPSLHV